MSEIPETLGQRLKAERERKGMTAQKAADELHLDGWVIDALESGDYVRIGPSVYAKGHLKRYAGLLGLPAAEILESYDTRSAAPAPAQPTLRMRTSASAGRKLPWAPIAGFALALAIGVVVWWKPWHPRTIAVPAAKSATAESAASGETAASAQRGAGAERAAGAEHAASGADVAAQPAAATGERAAADRVVEGRAQAVSAASPAAAIAQNDAESTAGLGRARLRLSFSADSWVDVHDAMGRRLFAGYGRANSVRSIAGAAPLNVYLRSASGVQLEVNNHAVAIGPQFVAGNVARFEAGADGVLRAVGRASSAGNPHPRG
ncbi:MAG TPA: RodZ domain-containing protein [Steroidobacteraceae bacterium]|jgi:cytoskeleton protein RodZ